MFNYVRKGSHPVQGMKPMISSLIDVSNRGRRGAEGVAGGHNHV